MLGFFMVGITVTVVLCFGAYLILQRRVLEEQMSLDDAKGFLLISSVLFSFMVCTACFYIGQVLGYDRQEETSTLLALSILLDITAGLISLIVGLQRMHEPEHY